MEQISIAEPLAKNGETCLSPQAWEHAPCPEVRSDTQCTDPHHSFFFVDLHSFSNSDLRGCMFGTCHAASRQPKVKDYIFPDTSRELATWPAPPRLTKALDCSRKRTQGCLLEKCRRPSHAISLRKMMPSNY